MQKKNNYFLFKKIFNKIKAIKKNKASKISNEINFDNVNSLSSIILDICLPEYEKINIKGLKPIIDEIKILILDTFNNEIHKF